MKFRLNLIMTVTYLLSIIPNNPFSIIISQAHLILLTLGCTGLLIISKALNYCIWHRLYIYLLLLFLIIISIWFCDIVFIVHGVLLLILISLCIYFKKGLCWNKCYLKCLDNSLSLILDFYRKLRLVSIWILVGLLLIKWLKKVKSLKVKSVRGLKNYLGQKNNLIL